MLLFIPRSLCALKRVAAKAEHARFGATQGIRIALASGVYRAEATDGRRALIVQGLVPGEDPPWPGFKELPDDACETIIMPKDLERACKIGEDFLQSRFGLFGIATMGNDVCLGLGSELVTARTVEGRFPNINQVIPKMKPLFTFSFDPKILAETLLAMAELLPETDRRVQLFYYGDGLPIGFCARNIDNGIMIDALVVPLTRPGDKPAKPTDEEPANGDEQSDQTEPEQSDQPEPEADEPTGPEESQESDAQEPKAPDAPSQESEVRESTARKSRKGKKGKQSVMQRYQEAKEKHAGMVLLFRIGDFYELYHDDATLVAPILGLTLTTRDKDVSMAGFPPHALQSYLRKLLQAGHRVAICDQVEDAAQAEVTRVVTPGAVTSDEGGGANG